MKKFKKHLQEEIQKTSRKGIPHFDGMKPMDFLKLVSFIQKETKGKIHSDKFHITEKIDGFPFRFGLDSKNQFFIESGWSGVVYSTTFFKDRAIKQELFDRMAFMTALDDFHVFLKSHKKLNETLSKYNSQGIKVVCEMLLNPTGKEFDDKIKFIKLSYDKNKIGEYATVALIDIITENNEPHPNSAKIISELVSVSDKTFKIVKLDPKSGVDVDLLVDINSLLKDVTTEHGDFTAIESILTSRKKVDQAQKKIIMLIISDYQSKMALKIRKQLESVNGDFGKDMEGLVFKIKDFMFKLTTSEFKNSTLVWEDD